MLAWGAVRAVLLLPVLVQTFAVQAAGPAAPAFVTAAQAASQSTQVPLSLIEATAYVNTRWEWINTASLSGGVGPMNVTPDQLSLAISLSGHAASSISTDLTANLEAGASLLAHYHTSGSDLASWSNAVATTQGPYVADEIYAVLRSGASRTLSTGESVTLAPATSASLPVGVAPNVGAAAAAATCAATSPDFGPPACWVAADSGNFSVANRGHDYPVDMIIIHDIEGSYGSAIQVFQRPGFEASAHYVVSYGGDVTQMVREHDIAWHAGNWDYNTRAIGIEHEGFAWTPGLYTTAEYDASARIAASICSRWGVPLDRTHVIGHNEVPDPNNPGLYGGVDHHSDPGPYWNWAYYMQQAQSDAATLPSPPRLMPDPRASSPDTTATVTWTPARTCRASAVPITGYTVVAQPGGMTQTLPANATSASFTGLKVGTTYTFTVTVTNADGQDSATSNPVVAGACSPTATPVATSYFAWFDTATPGMDGDNIHLLNTGSGQSIGCVLLGSQAIPYSLGAGQSTHVKFRNGSIGGPVVVRVMTGAGVLASQRVQFNQSFNEVWSAGAAQAATKSYFNWFDKASPGMLNDNIHVLNPGGTAADVTIQLSGSVSQLLSVAPGAEAYATFPQGTIGGPVTVSSTQPVLASQRVQYNQTFNEVWALNPAQASATSYFNWYDKASPGMLNDNVHLLNPGTTSADVTVSLAGAAPRSVSVGPGAETYVSFPQGTIGGPVTVTATQPVLASQRVQYYSSFNEVPALIAARAATTSYINWYDKASAGMVNDNIHLLNPGNASASVTVSVPGATAQVVTVGPGGEVYVTFPSGTIGGPLTVSATQPVLASQRVQYYQTFNEIPSD